MHDETIPCSPPTDTMPVTLDPESASYYPEAMTRGSLRAPKLPSFGSLGDYDYLLVGTAA